VLGRRKEKKAMVLRNTWLLAENPRSEVLFSAYKIYFSAQWLTKK